MQEARTHAHTDKVSRLCEYIRTHCGSGESMQLPQLSRQVGLSPFHLQRIFTRIVGVSPTQYVQACRMQTLRTNLRESSSVTDAIFDSGFSSSSRVYERVDEDLGMTPSSYRTGGKGLDISYVTVTTSVGELMIGATDRGLCSVQLGGTEEALLVGLRAEYPKAQLLRVQEPYSDLFKSSIQALQRHLYKRAPLDQLPIDIRATAFQLKVWKYLQAIPVGDVKTYAEVAKQIGQPTAVRAVARACASNPLALVIPCHRVIRSDGKLGGYRWGLDRKQHLLHREMSEAEATAQADRNQTAQPHS